MGRTLPRRLGRREHAIVAVAELVAAILQVDVPLDRGPIGTRQRDHRLANLGQDADRLRDLQVEGAVADVIQELQLRLRRPDGRLEQGLERRQPLGQNRITTGPRPLDGLAQTGKLLLPVDGQLVPNFSDLGRNLHLRHLRHLRPPGPIGTIY